MRFWRAGAPARILLVLLASALVMIVAPPVISSAQPAPDQGPGMSGPLAVRLDSITPSVVTGTTGPDLTVTGTITNTSSSAAAGLAVRLQRAARVSTESQLLSTALLAEPDYPIFTPSIPVADTLEPGESQSFTASFPLLPEEGDSLYVRETGIFPILVNVTAQHEGFGIRDHSARFLLPVLELPPGEAPDDVPARSGDDERAEAGTEAPARDPVPLTMLWPLVDEPSIAPGSSAGEDGPTLSTDALAGALAPGGRLDVLLAVAGRAIAPTAPGSALVSSSLCLLIDPDLLSTINAMGSGYQVSLAGGGTAPGNGAGIAGRWLDRLRALAQEVCIVAAPAAQADLEALARLQLPGLTERSLTRGTDVLATILGAQPVQGVTIPDEAVISAQAADMLAGTPADAVVISDDAALVDARPPRGERFAALSTPGSGSLPAMLLDGGQAQLLAAMGEEPSVPVFAEQAGTDPASKDRLARLQDTIAAVAWPSLAERGDGAPAAPSATLLLPPREWTISAAEGDALMSSIATLMLTNKAIPAPFGAIADEARQPGAGHPPGTVQYPQRHEDVRVPDSVLEDVLSASRSVEQLASALVTDPTLPLTPDAFLAPLRDDLVRALTTAGRADPGTASRAAARRAESVSQAIARMHDQITILNPGGVQTLASAQSPLLLIARNDLPVPVRVRIVATAPPGVAFEELGTQQLPPRGSRQLSIPTRVTNNRPFAVDLRLSTPDGDLLGESIRISVRSTAYGRIMTILTGTAGALLLLLAGRRLWHRFRGQPDPADEGHEHT
ncbi:hypothetical protein HT102_11115 [Hoyosella sp. G463]|uniref:Glycoprotein n=1 Tax=Lolliginicoccus lacisalsi TaxID=2742202 RepID=A0A927JCY7_9ACTN|nr:DUF6049 family protein [Lolliginicoccus lacisalsi]MBD8507038.1 hypothetical protein [Lolliginicoccus lacisalsi]